MRNLLLTLCYDGAGYHGWQIQENALAVQQVLQEMAEDGTIAEISTEWFGSDITTFAK